MGDATAVKILPHYISLSGDKEFSSFDLRESRGVSEFLSHTGRSLNALTGAISRWEGALKAQPSISEADAVLIAQAKGYKDRLAAAKQGLEADIAAQEYNPEKPSVVEVLGANPERVAHLAEGLALVRTLGVTAREVVERPESTALDLVEALRAAHDSDDIITDASLVAAGDVGRNIKAAAQRIGLSLGAGAANAKA
ncbi:MAG: hypothetical protein SFX19_07095 [Alphaproteobacteria bacterium]|nr:hypothetical protein [Alphaproteobacteria bacterium]